MAAKRNLRSLCRIESAIDRLFPPARALYTDWANFPNGRRDRISRRPPVKFHPARAATKPCPSNSSLTAIYEQPSEQPSLLSRGEVCVCEVIPLEQQWFAAGLGQSVGETVAEI